MRNIIYSSSSFFYDFDTALLVVHPCMDLLLIDNNLSYSAINKIFLEKSFLYRNNAASFYTDESKLDAESPSGVGVYSPNFELRIAHRLPETSVFTAEAWAILFAVNAASDLNCSRVIFSDSKSILDVLPIV